MSTYTRPEVDFQFELTPPMVRGRRRRSPKSSCGMALPPRQGP